MNSVTFSVRDGDAVLAGDDERSRSRLTGLEDMSSVIISDRDGDAALQAEFLPIRSFKDASLFLELSRLLFPLDAGGSGVLG
jgi:hypothetical protein